MAQDGARSISRCEDIRPGAYRIHWSLRTPGLVSHPAKQKALPVMVPRMSVQWNKVWESWEVEMIGMEAVSLTAATSWASV